MRCALTCMRSSSRCSLASLSSFSSLCYPAFPTVSSSCSSTLSRQCTSNGALAPSKLVSRSYRASPPLRYNIYFFASHSILTHVSCMYRILLGYFIAYITYIPPIMKFRKQQRRDPEGTQPEARLWWLLWSVLLSILSRLRNIADLDSFNAYSRPSRTHRPLRIRVDFAWSCPHTLDRSHVLLCADRHR